MALNVAFMSEAWLEQHSRAWETNGVISGDVSVKELEGLFITAARRFICNVSSCLQSRTWNQLPSKQDLRAHWNRSRSLSRTLSTSHFLHRVMECVFNHIRHMDVHDVYHDFNVCASFFSLGPTDCFGVLDEASLVFTGGRRARKARSSCWIFSIIALPDSYSS